MYFDLLLPLISFSHRVDCVRKFGIENCSFFSLTFECVSKVNFGICYKISKTKNHENSKSRKLKISKTQNLENSKSRKLKITKTQNLEN